MIFANPFARIVVGYDATPPARAALAEALVLAEQYGGEIVVVHVSDVTAAAVLELPTRAGPAPADAAPLLGSLDASRHALVDDLAARVQAAAVRVRLDFSTNGVVAGIVDAAVRWNATAIAVGTHGRTGVARTFLGSIAEGVVRGSPVPVVVTRGVAPARALQRVLVGVDATAASARASVYASALAQSHPVRLIYAGVAEMTRLAGMMGELPVDPTPFLNELRAEARDALDAALQYANAADVYPDTDLGEAGDVTAGLLNAARRHDADAIVVGTRERGGLERFVLGSTADATLRRSSVPVIVVPANAVIVPGPRAGAAAGA